MSGGEADFHKGAKAKAHTWQKSGYNNGKLDSKVQPHQTPIQPQPKSVGSNPTPKSPYDLERQCEIWDDVFYELEREKHQFMLYTILYRAETKTQVLSKGRLLHYRTFAFNPGDPEDQKRLEEEMFWHDIMEHIYSETIEWPIINLFRQAEKRHSTVNWDQISKPAGLNAADSNPVRKCPESLVYVRYRDHVLYHRGDPSLMKPQMREAVGWLVYDCHDYVIISWDRDASPPTLRGRDPKASGLVLLRSDILELRKAS